MNAYHKYDTFKKRHIGPNEDEIASMLNELGCVNTEDLLNRIIPSNIRIKEPLPDWEGKSELDFIDFVKSIASKNKVAESYIGMGYYPTVLPPVIQRNILENPGWYTQYTPYQAEISQGRLEALMNFQTMISDLTGLPVANASLLDEATAAAEAMLMLHSVSRKKDANKFFVDEDIFPQTLSVLEGRAETRGIELVVGKYDSIELTDSFFGLFVQYPAGSGIVRDYREFFAKAAEKKIFISVASDIMSLLLLTPPGEIGADVVVGSTQRFGVPMGFGGPHAAFFATTDKHKRSVPGRIIGQSIDAEGNQAYRMALQTREQHIRREKATSNICTAQVLLAIIASMYAVYHGPGGLKDIAMRIHALTTLLSSTLRHFGFNQQNESFFDTLRVSHSDKEVMNKVKKTAEEKLFNFRYFDDGSIGISLSEATGFHTVKTLAELFAQAVSADISEDEFNSIASSAEQGCIPAALKRESDFLTHPVFNTYHSETEMLRYLKKLENRDLSLTYSMIPLGSCTMKLNATAEMVGITYPELCCLHPFAPAEQTEGYKELIDTLGKYLVDITGMHGVSFQPNSGAQGEFTGLMVIREYHKSRGEENRVKILIPSSAHGTNPASAVMAGMEVVVVACDEQGNIDIEDLRAKTEEHKENLAGLMVTYPSTHGVFEEDILEITSVIHNNGGQVYLDGANMNAQVGITSPASIGADVCHLNLHKTFAIPHGGGGPGMGPICTAEHLTPFLPDHPVVKTGGTMPIKSVSAAPYGSPSILVISLGYIMMLGSAGLRKATEAAIISANYLMKKIEPYFTPLYTGKKGFVGHELIFDLRDFKRTAGIEVEDIAKRLMDYGFHAPTISFPVAGTFMVEPTESESLNELQRFIDALAAIRKEIEEIENGTMDKENNPLKNAPHTMAMVVRSNWKRPYSREKAAFPTPWTETNKFWPSVARINNAYGDRNLVCTCTPVEDYK